MGHASLPILILVDNHVDPTQLICLQVCNFSQKAIKIDFIFSV